MCYTVKGHQICIWIWFKNLHIHCDSVMRMRNWSSFVVAISVSPKMRPPNLKMAEPEMH